MKIYNYVAFSVYGLLKRVNKKDDKRKLLYKTSLIISLIMVLVSFTIKGILELNGYNDTVIPPLYLFLWMIIVLIINYLCLKKRGFQENGFEFTWKNTVVVIVLISGIITVFILVADKNRERIFRKRNYSQDVTDRGGIKPFNPDEKPQSLEGEVRLWLYDTFEKKDSAESK
ncbi:hypothetical protein [Chryseobacterium hagamense]|uniref:Uncharacterized protein n=1 Tax=Chryseobacterium hagamense TaxID=395935 RepID=A0A511YLM2_9FLAO|nr:hypothetical protein [Chryseobacterium hagamense]GEN76104.1 hypothetical protein CHA01nite_18440 [Chryseobacterium hagamense]